MSPPPEEQILCGQRHELVAVQGEPAEQGVAPEGTGRGTVDAGHAEAAREPAEHVHRAVDHPAAGHLLDSARSSATGKSTTAPESRG